MSRPGEGDREGGQKTTPETSLQRMLNTTGLSSESDAEAGSNEEEEEDDDDDEEPDLDALATRLSAKVGRQDLPHVKIMCIHTSMALYITQAARVAACPSVPCLRMHRKVRN